MKKPFDYFIPFWGATLCFYRSGRSGWRMRIRRETIQDNDAGLYDVFVLINTPVLNFCISNYLQKVNERTQKNSTP